ncbi:MAG: flippase-like domain-containing protein [Clostridiales bacterium]|nr:flippase-like domain-containing protein [Clostridiales bacterium]
MTKKVRKQLINIAFLIVLIGVTLTVLFVSQDINIHDIGNFLYHCNPWYIAAAFGGLLGYIVFEAISLHIIAHKLGHKSKFTSSLAYSSSDLYYSAITPSASGGQPASAFYMMRDGMSGGTAGFTVLFNIIAYTVATILVGLFGVVACPAMFGQIGHWLAKTLVIVGFVIQLALLGVLLLCLFRARVIMAIGNWGISVLTKLHIVKKTEKWRNKLEGMVTKYKSCRTVIKKHPMLFFNALILNIAQRVSQTLIPCFVIMASPLFGQVDVTFLELFCMQAYVMIGYNSIPLPGGTGVYEYLYPNVFGIGFPDMTFVLSAMMVSRGISFYVSMVITGLYTLVYHAIGIKKIKGGGDGAGSDAPPDIPEDVDVYTALKSDSVIHAIEDEDRVLATQTKVKNKDKYKNKQTDETANNVVPPDAGVTYSDGQSEKIQLDEQSKDEASDDGNN